MQKGFSLIETLVVVLIIGILTAVALPRYQKAVLRARFANLVRMARTLTDAQHIHYETYKRYAETKDELDIDVPDTKDITCVANYNKNYILCTLFIGGKKLITYERELQVDYDLCCVFKSNNYEGQSLCETEMGTKSWYNGCGADGTCHCYARMKN